ncbi:hypothetical protein V8G54_005269 [Vigna mungo]|uniref:Reverse transcriptase Ty1/copia-type domain-containing protein n=1 Tax=Vigna mungo TaxID=3915 RepID=A0AAQ3P053_VIGMU
MCPLIAHVATKCFRRSQLKAFKSKPKVCGKILSSPTRIEHDPRDSPYYYVTIKTTKLRPFNYKEALKHAHWRQAMQEEIIALEHNHTWTITTLPPNKKAIWFKWVYKTKKKVDGTIDRFKACLVAKGYTQKEVIDYFDTFSPVVKLTNLSEKVYMQLPPGITAAGKNQVARSKEDILLSQRKYALDLLTKTRMLDVAPVSTLMNFSIKISFEGDPLEDPTLTVIGTGLDVLIPVNQPLDTLSTWVTRQSPRNPKSNQRSHPATIYCDNMFVIKIDTNQVFHELTKHIEIDCNLIREKVQEGTVKLLPIHTTLQLADILTNPLPPSTFHNINSKLGSINICAKL